MDVVGFSVSRVAWNARSRRRLRSRAHLAFGRVRRRVVDVAVFVDRQLGQGYCVVGLPLVAVALLAVQKINLSAVGPPGNA